MSGWRERVAPLFQILDAIDARECPEGAAGRECRGIKTSDKRQVRREWSAGKTIGELRRIIVDIVKEKEKLTWEVPISRIKLEGPGTKELEEAKSRVRTVLNQRVRKELPQIVPDDCKLPQTKRGKWIYPQEILDLEEGRQIAMTAFRKRAEQDQTEAFKRHAREQAVAAVAVLTPEQEEAWDLCGFLPYQELPLSGYDTSAFQAVLSEARQAGRHEGLRKFVAALTPKEVWEWGRTWIAPPVDLCDEDTFSSETTGYYDEKQAESFFVRQMTERRQEMVASGELTWEGVA